MATYFISDLHLDHENILKFAGKYRDGATVEEHNQILIDKINSRVHKHDKLFVLGDVAMSRKGLAMLDQLRCRERHLIIGNHDDFPLHDYLRHFNKVHGFMFHKGFWLSHAPIHPTELRGRKNIHGHVHQNYINDPNYICVCVEPLNGYPISFDEIVAIHGKPQHYDKTIQQKFDFGEIQ